MSSELRASFSHESRDHLSNNTIAVKWPDRKCFGRPGAKVMKKYFKFVREIWVLDIGGDVTHIVPPVLWNCPELSHMSQEDSICPT